MYHHGVLDSYLLSLYVLSRSVLCVVLCCQKDTVYQVEIKSVGNMSKLQILRHVKELTK
jgi:hypothetical protein